MSYSTRIMLFLTIMIGVAAILIAIFVFSAKQTVEGLEGKDFIPALPVDLKGLQETEN